MPRDLTTSYLCRLINRTVDGYTDYSRVLKKEEENELLVKLSQVLNDIRLRTRELDRDGNSKAKEQHEVHNCLMKVLRDLMILIGAESQFVRQLARNVLVAVSEFIAVSGSGWDTFIGLLCDSLRLAIANALSCADVSLLDGSAEWNWVLPSFGELDLALKNANWFTVAGVVGVLRESLKYLEQEDADQFFEAYLNFVCSMLLNFPWDHIDEFFISQGTRTCEIEPKNDDVGIAFLGNAGKLEPKVLFLGNLLQLLCSLVERVRNVETGPDLQDQHPLYSVLMNSVPKISRWCLEYPGCANVTVKHYFRHKLLVLMLRLTYQAHLSGSTIFSWLQILHGYFKELLQRSIILLDHSLDECLVDSPFLLGFYRGEGNGTHSLHLQRLAVFLFLRCCLILICLTGETNRSCGSETSNCLTTDSVVDPDSCRKKGSSELYKWLQCHISTEVLMDYKTYSQKYMGFASLFLKLYMHEDDLLFKVLLQLISVPSYSERGLLEEKCSFENVKDNILLHLSNLFNPIRLFHLFLAELHYDHQVLLDYLISKDTGISCAEYLLRSLRTVCNSWTLFKNFSMDGNVATDTSRKRKFWLDDYQAQCSQPSSVEEECERDYEHKFSHSKSHRFQFEEAKDCLLSLKSSVENLHQKNLFPYNPEAILKRLRSFQELCLSPGN